YSAWRASASDKSEDARRPFGNETREGKNHWWGTNQPQKESVWYQVDLGSRQSFSRIDLGGGFQELKVQVSDTGQDWDARPPLLVLNDLPSVADIALSTPVQGRYLRLLFVRPAQNSWFGLHWIDLYQAEAMVTKSP